MFVRLTLVTGLLAVSALTFSAPGLAQQPASTSDEIVVTGERLREMTEAYAGAVAVAPAAADQYPRWDTRLCTRVAGLSPADAQTLIDHIARRAHAVGVQAERVGCQPNLVIIFAPDGDQLAREIVDQRRDLLGYYSEDDVVTAGRDALEAFANTPRPVRWWHVARTTTADGRQLTDTHSSPGDNPRAAQEASGEGPGDPQATANAILGGSRFENMEGVRSQGTRMRRATRHDLSFALVIVDTRRTAGAAPAAVADYLAMATLVQLNPNADMSAFPSVLNLFQSGNAGAAAPAGMTDWDLAYLEGLYGATREAASANRQRADIARRMAEEVSH